jgi:hypothetical protein
LGTTFVRDAVIYHAAIKGQSAAGLPGRVSYFTDTLERCLTGMGARPSSSVFCAVDHESLGIAAKELMEQVGEENSLQLKCSIDAHTPVPRRSAPRRLREFSALRQLPTSSPSYL